MQGRSGIYARSLVYRGYIRPAFLLSLAHAYAHATRILRARARVCEYVHVEMQEVAYKYVRHLQAWSRRDESTKAKRRLEEETREIGRIQLCECGVNAVSR